MNDQPNGPLWRGIILGLSSLVAGLAVSQLVGGLLGSGLSPINGVGAEFIDVTPAWLKNLAIDWFGTNDKLVLQLGIGVVLGLVSIAIGLLAQRGRMSWAYGLTVVIGIVGVLALSQRPNAGSASVFATIIGTVVSAAVLYYLTPFTRSPVAADAGSEAAPRSPTAAGAAGRRDFLRRVGVLGVGSFAVGYLGSVLGRRNSVADERADVVLSGVDDSVPAANTGTLVDPESFLIPDAATLDGGAALPQPPTVLGAVSGPTEFGLADVSPFVVPDGKFYKIDTALSVPQVSIDDWQLKIHGMVDNEMVLTFQDLLDRPQIERDITLSCVSNQVGGGLVGNATWQGVRLADLLNEAGIQDGATQVASFSVDGWSCGSPTAQIMDGRDAMVAIGMNGAPLPPGHGYPARLVVPGLFGYVSATKWVTEIKLVRWEDFDGYWMPRGWSKLGPVKTMARIDRPRAAHGIDRSDDGAVDIAGMAWAVHRGISKVEVSIDDGEWVECDLAGVPSDDTWRQWRYRWVDATDGEHKVTARAYDGNGVVQPAGPKAEIPDGAEGYHTVNFRV